MRAVQQLKLALTEVIFVGLSELIAFLAGIGLLLVPLQAGQGSGGFMPYQVAPFHERWHLQPAVSVAMVDVQRVAVP